MSQVQQFTPGSLQIMPSSWIRDIDYNTLTNELRINMRGKWYGPWFVSMRTYMKFISGKAVPVTTDTKRPPRWARGIGPSLGAAYHKYIKIGGVVSQITRRVREFRAQLNPAVKGQTIRGLLGRQVSEKYSLLEAIK